jgi:hypothetical protein
MDWISELPPIAVAMLSTFGLAAFIVLWIFSDAIFNVLLIIPGHFILMWYMRIAKVTDAQKNFDAHGEVSGLVGAGFWCTLAVIGYGLYRVSKYVSV